MWTVITLVYGAIMCNVLGFYFYHYISTVFSIKWLLVLFSAFMVVFFYLGGMFLFILFEYYIFT